jgi:hypothetical protein
VVENQVAAAAADVVTATAATTGACGSTLAAGAAQQ